MKNNKGYSLVELLVALAIFSLVMLGITTLMSTTASSYKSGLEEAVVQEEAQIAANQISDYLMDATSIISSSNPYKFEYYKTNADNSRTLSTFSLIYDSDEEKVYLNDVTHVLAENVTNFDIDGLSVGLGEDNCADVTLGIEKGGASYESTKRVFFRNNLEDPNYKDILHVGSQDTGSTDEYKAEVEIRRYEEFNASADYNIVEGAALNAAANNYYQLVESANPMISGKKQYVVKLKTINNFDFSVPKSSKCELTGKDSYGTDIKILLFTEKVQIGSADESENIVVINYDNQTNMGFGTYIDVKGINVNEACKSINVKYKGTLKYGGNSYSTNDTNLQYKNQLNMFPDSSFNGVDFVKIGIVTDPCSNGIFVTKANDSLTAKSGVANAIAADPNATVTYEITFNNDPSLKYTLKCKLFIEGKSRLK